MICLSFDLEEFDIPFEYGGTIPFPDQIAISREGTLKILNLLEKHAVRATFFTTVVFAQENIDLIRKIVAAGHELASHTYHHSSFEVADLKKSRLALEEISGQKILGLRMPRMQKVQMQDIRDAGYFYDSSLNPTWLPGRYNHLDQPRQPFFQDGVWELPASVSPTLRLPLFWLMFHHLPLNAYLYLAKRTYKNVGHLNIYFHPWEFMDIYHPAYKIPSHMYKNMGDRMVQKFSRFLELITKQNYATTPLSSVYNAAK